MSKAALLVLSATLLLLLLTCKNENKPAPATQSIQGGQFSVVQSGEGEPVHPGNWLKLQVVQSYYDTILRDSRVNGHEYLKYDTGAMTAASLSVFQNAKEGDSLEFKIPRDSAFRIPRPAFTKEPGYLVTRVKILRILRTDKELEQDKVLTRPVPSKSTRFKTIRQIQQNKSGPF